VLALYRLGVCYEKNGETEKAGACARKLVGHYAAAVSNNAELAAWTKRYAQPDEAAAINDKRRQKMMQKLNSIVIPSLDFRDSNIADVINWLNKQAIINDTNSPAGEKGVNFILMFKCPKAADTTTPGTPPPALTNNIEGEIIPDAVGIPLVDLTLRNVVLLEAIKYITSITGLKYRIDPNAVVIMPMNIPEGDLITKTYRVLPSLGDLIKGATITSTNEPTEVYCIDVKKFFVESGVPFPTGTSIKYRPSLNLLIVANTVEYHEKFEQILGLLNVIPTQVKVQVDHIEITDPDIARRFQRRCPTAAELRRLPSDAYCAHSSLSVITKSGAEAEARSMIAPDGGLTNDGFGARLNCTPVVGPDGYTIDICIGWRSTSVIRANPPLVGRMFLTQSLTIWDNEALVLPVQSPGGAEVAGKAKAVAGAHYLIIAPTLIDPAGRRVNKNSGGARSDSASW
jgi:hypothetical protein